jgi:hypothetical protein
MISMRFARRAAYSLAMVTVMLLGGVTLIAAAGCENHQLGDEVTRNDTFQVGSSPSLVVDSANGRITVRSGADNVIDVSAVLRNPDRLDYRIIQTGDSINVTAESMMGKFDFNSSPGADITVTVPASTDVDIRTSNGRVEIDGIDGTTRARTSNGAIDLSNLDGEVEARTNNGSIEYRGSLPVGSSNELRTSNGSISVSFQSEPNVGVDASTSNGKVSVNRPISTRRSEPTYIVGTIGQPESNLIIRTSNGSVTIK